MRLCYGAYLGCETGIEFRDPLGDPRVIESALAIPNEMFFDEQDKWVLRTMMKGRLPDMVRLNTKKGSKVPIFRQGYVYIRKKWMISLRKWNFRDSDGLSIWNGFVKYGKRYRLSLQITR